MAKKNTVLLVDDDPFFVAALADALEDAGYTVLTAETGAAGLETVRQRHGRVDLVLLDMMMRWRKGSRSLDTDRLSGLRLARMLKKEFPRIRLVALSVLDDKTVQEWFEQYGNGSIRKPVPPPAVLDRVHFALYGKRRRRPKCFIVHGHDETALRDLKRFLRSELRIPDPVVLRDQPNLGRTLIEKFEQAASEVDVAFVLLTPDDTALARRSPAARKRRARQNVIFELGYFYAKLQRSAGKVILLHRGALELPTDIAGIAYIDITRGIRPAGTQIRRELTQWT